MNIKKFIFEERYNMLDVVVIIMLAQIFARFVELILELIF